MTLSVSNLGIDGLEDIEQIGTGGSSRVYRARQIDLDRIVAVKVLNPGHDQGVSKRFDRERKAMGRLSLHEGIVPVYSSGATSHGEPYLVMPYYANGSLQDQIDTGAMEWQTAVSYVDVAAETIAAAHDEGVVHLDLKPANILLTNQGAPRIADFGIAKLLSGQGASAGTTGGAAFTPAYSAPETFLDGETGPPSDVYGLGATLWALLVGHPPFLTPGDDTNLMAVIGRVVNNPVGDLRHFTPSPICEVIERAMSKQPEDRFQTARDFSLALKTAAAASSPDFPPVDATENTVMFPAATVSAETRLLQQVDTNGQSAAYAAAAAAQAGGQSRPLLQETAQPMSAPNGGPPSVTTGPMLDLDRFRPGPILLGLLAFLGVIGLSTWALTRSPATETNDTQTTITVPAAPAVSEGDATADEGAIEADAGDDADATTDANNTAGADAGITDTTAVETTVTSAPETTVAEVTTTTEAPETTIAETTSSIDETTTTLESTTTSEDTATTVAETTTTIETTTTTEATTSSTTPPTSSTVTTTTTTTTPSVAPTVTITRVERGTNAITVSFSSNQCVARYRVSATGPNNQPIAVPVTVSEPCKKNFEQTIEQLLPGTEYTLAVVVFNADNKRDTKTRLVSTRN